MIKRIRRPAEPTLRDIYQYGFGTRELPPSQLLAGDMQSQQCSLGEKDTVLL